MDVIATKPKTTESSSDAMGQSSSHGQNRSSSRHNHSNNNHNLNSHNENESSSSPGNNHRTRNGSITMNGCHAGVSARGLLRRASSLTGTSSSKLRGMRSPFTKRKKRSGPLSATFTAPNAINVETMDINAATEEQLMTLPGVDRRLAQNVVEYRGRIGGKFQKIDDLALVSGMGATRLDKIRSEICVRRLQSARTAPTASLNGSLSSRTPSIDSVSTTNGATGDVSAMMPRIAPLNVNTATVFELQQLPGLNQELAAKIVEYRQKKGGYKTVEHVRKVKGISSRRLLQLRPFLFAHSGDSMSFSSFSSTPLKLQPSHQQSSAMNSSCFGATTTESAPPTPGPLTSSHRKSVSVPMRMNLKLVNGYKNAPVDDIFELLGAYSHRPVVADDFRYERNGNRAMRVASWNLDRMSMAKADNPGVLEVVCRTILENKLSIICVQEVTDVKALARICDELNEPSLKRVAEWRENALQWKYVADENCEEGRVNGLGFIYDNHQCRFLAKLSQGIELMDGKETSEKNPSSYLGVFQLEDWTLTVLNLYLRYFDLRRTTEIVEKMRVSLQDAPIDFENVYLVVGDFTGLAEGASELEALSMGTRTMAVKEREKVIQVNGEGTNVSGGKRKIDWRIDGASSLENADDEEEEDEDTSPTAQNGRDSITVDDIFNDFQYGQVFEANTTSFVDLAHVKEIDDGLNVRHAPPKNIKRSSCNILCRDKLPPVMDPFLQAIYRTKSPFDLPKVPSVKESCGGGRLTGYSSVIREGLCHMAIPREWTWGGPASDHCPLWIECYKRVKREVVANGGGSAGRVNKEVMAPQPVMRLTEAMNGLTLKLATTPNGGTVMENGVKVAKKKTKRLSSSGGSADEERSHRGNVQ